MLNEREDDEHVLKLVRIRIIPITSTQNTYKIVFVTFNGISNLLVFMEEKQRSMITFSLVVAVVAGSRTSNCQNVKHLMLFFTFSCSQFKAGVEKEKKTMKKVNIFRKNLRHISSI